MSGRLVLAFVDNDSARDAAVRGYSPSLPSAYLVAALWMCLAESGAHVWIDRVPGPSNLAHSPSRLDFSTVEALGGKRVFLGRGDWVAVAARAQGAALQHGQPTAAGPWGR